MDSWGLQLVLLTGDLTGVCVGTSEAVWTTDSSTEAMTTGKKKSVSASANGNLRTTGDLWD